MQVELEVHLQILLAVGLAVLCFLLAIGCIICCWHQSHPTDDKEAGLSVPPPPADHVTLTLSPAPSINTLPIKQQYEELDGDVLDYPSFHSSSTPSEDDVSCSSLPPARIKSRFSLRRLSSPVVSSKPTKPAVRVRSSLPIIPKLSLAVKSQKRKNVDDDDSVSRTETVRLNAENTQHYGSNSHKPTPSLHFTLLFSPSEGKLTITVLGLYRGPRRLSGATVRVSLPPLFPEAPAFRIGSGPEAPALRIGSGPEAPALRIGSGPEAPAQVFPVRSLDELRFCTLRLAASSRDFSGLRETAVGELDLPCAELHWEPESTVAFSCQLNPAKRRMRKSHSSHDAVGPSVHSVRFLGRILILLQIQTPAHRMKILLRKAESLPKLSRIPGTPEHYIIINLRQDGVVISSKETKCASGANPVWNTPFLFDLPAGDIISRPPLLLEFVVMQGRRYTKSCILGRVLIGQEASEAGLRHWSEMRCRAPAETEFWHQLQPDSS